MKSRFSIILAWLGLLGVAGLTWLLAIWSNQYLEAKDPFIFIRTLINRTAGASLGVVLLTGSLILVDFVTPKNWLEKIYENPLACAIVVSAILYCVAWLITYA